MLANTNGNISTSCHGASVFTQSEYDLIWVTTRGLGAGLKIRRRLATNHGKSFHLEGIFSLAPQYQLKASQMEWNIIFRVSRAAWGIICKIFAFPILYLDHQPPPPTSPPTGTISSCTISNQNLPPWVPHPLPVFRKQMMDRQPAGEVKTKLLYNPDN